MSVDMSTMSGRDAREIRTDNRMIDSRFGPVRVVRMFPSVEDYFHGRADADAPHLFFSPGWGEKVQTSWMFGAALAKAGFALTMFNYPVMNRRIVPVDSVQAFRSEVIGDVMDATEGPKWVIGHSEGAFQALHAAANRDDIEAALLAAPAGLSGTFKPTDLVKCALHEAKDAVHGSRSNVLGAAALGRAMYGLARNLAGSPQLSGAEVLSIAATDAKPELETSIERGVRMGIVACRHDRIFPSERILAHLDGLENKIERYTELDTNHFDFLMRDENAAEVIDEAKILFGTAS